MRLYYYQRIKFETRFKYATEICIYGLVNIAEIIIVSGFAIKVELLRTFARATLVALKQSGYE